MKLAPLAMTLVVMWSAGASAADASPGNSPVVVRDLVPYLESRYQGEVVAIALDASGDKAAHYHVDMRYRDAGTSKLDVDATTLEISGRDAPRWRNG